MNDGQPSKWQRMQLSTSRMTLQSTVKGDLLIVQYAAGKQHSAPPSVTATPKGTLRSHAAVVQRAVAQVGYWGTRRHEHPGEHVIPRCSDRAPPSHRRSKKSFRLQQLVHHAQKASMVVAAQAQG
jgi:hypothetical protein